MWKLESAEVPGGYGDNAVLDYSVLPHAPKRLHVEIQGWLGDDIMEVTPSYFVTERLAQELARSRLTGYKLASMEVTESMEFRELQPDVVFPKVYWMQVGSDPSEDFWLASDGCLVVSEPAMILLQRFTLGSAEFKRMGDTELT